MNIISTAMKKYLSIISLFLSFNTFAQKQGRSMEPCYSNQTHFSQKGVAGMLMGKTIYYEIWDIMRSMGLRNDYIILRTDTSDIDSLDFCLCSLAAGCGKDSISFSRIGSDGYWREDSLMTIDKFPTLFQPLVYGMYGWQHFDNFNKGGKDDARIYIKGSTLYLQYWVYPAGDSYLYRDSYKFNGKHFVFQNEKTLKRIP
jgi:hypothetical protein